MIQLSRISAVLLLSANYPLQPAANPRSRQEPPAQAHKLLAYARQLDDDAKQARTSGQKRALARAEQSGEQLLNQRTHSNNGIYVDIPKVYDDALLQQMLGSAQSHLSQLQGFDQGSLTRAIGAVTGADQQISSFGISAGVQPPVQVTSYGNIASPFPPPSGAAPAPTTSLPSSPSPSASDILDEQVQITAQITNLRLLLEGSLSDQIMVGRDETFAKPRVTLGFPSSFRPRNVIAMPSRLSKYWWKPTPRMTPAATANRLPSPPCFRKRKPTM